MKYKKPVIIIGGGIMGTSIAKRFLNNDFEVHLFNRFSKSRFKFIGKEIKKKIILILFYMKISIIYLGMNQNLLLKLLKKNWF